MVLPRLHHSLKCKQIDQTTGRGAAGRVWDTEAALKQAAVAAAHLQGDAQLLQGYSSCGEGTRRPSASVLGIRAEIEGPSHTCSAHVDREKPIRVDDIKPYQSLQRCICTCVYIF